MSVRIEESWQKELQEEFKKPYFANLIQVLKEEKKAGKVIYPAGKYIFKKLSRKEDNLRRRSDKG